MSTDLETLLRTAADGPVPDIDVAELRRRGVRRRRASRMLAAGGALVVAAVAVVTATTLSPVPVPSVADQPSPPGPPATTDDPPSLAQPAPGVRIQIGGIEGDAGCRIELVVDEAVRSVAVLREPPGANLCGPSPTVAEVRTAAIPYTEVPLDGGPNGRRHAIGLVDEEILAVRLHLENGPPAELNTRPTPAPDGTSVRSYAALLPAGAVVVSVEGLGADGTAVTTTETTPPTPLGFFPVRDETYTTMAPTDDVPLELPTDDDPLGGWRPTPSPVDLSPLSARAEEDELWFLRFDAGGSELVDRDDVARRLGSSDAARELCAFLTGEVAEVAALDAVVGTDPEVVAENVVHLVLRAAEVDAGAGLNVALVAACDLAVTG